MKHLLIVLPLFAFGCGYAKKYVSQKDAEDAMKHVGGDLKQLEQRTKQLEQRVADLEAEKNGSRRPIDELTAIKLAEINRLRDQLEQQEKAYKVLKQKREKDKELAESIIEEQRRAINNAEYCANGLRQRIADLEAEAKTKDLQAKIDELERQIKVLKEKERQQLAKLPTSQGRSSSNWVVITPQGSHEANYPPGSTETEIARRR